MKIVLKTISGMEYEPEEITEINFTCTAGIACDSIRLRFKSSDHCDEIVTVKAFNASEMIFNGYCDNQRISEDGGGYEVYIYARSSACILVDNEAEPFTYNMPTANQLCFTFARPFGFSGDMPVIESKEKYEVTKGTSCYGAISGFVSMAAGKHIYISPQNRIQLLEKSEDIENLGKYGVLSAATVINRSEPLTEVRFKKTSSASGYRLHMRAQARQDFNFNERVRYVNLSSLPQWQREYTVLKTLKDSFEDYQTLEVTVTGYMSKPLLQRFSYSSAIGEYENYVLTEKEYIYSTSGERTRLTLKKEIDIKEITYVD